MADEYNEETCKEKHQSDRLRLTALEVSLKDNLERIYKKLDRPSWLVTFIISGLSTSSGMLAMWVITHPSMKP